MMYHADLMKTYYFIWNVYQHGEYKRKYRKIIFYCVHCEIRNGLPLQW
jgi:hypothetical protein